MTTFDENKLTPANYNINNAIHSVKYQAVVEEFMDVVRDDPAYLFSNQHLFEKFREFVDRDEVWPLAMMLVPEFHKPTTHDTTEKTAMNVILAMLKHRRPEPPVDDTSGDVERMLVKRQVIQCVDSIVGYGKSDLTDQQRQEADDLVAKAMSVIGKCPLKKAESLLTNVAKTIRPIDEAVNLQIGSLHH